MSEAAEKLKFRVGGMDCGACVTKIENAVGRLPGVREVGVSLPNGTLTVLRSGEIAKGAIERQVKALGYQIVPANAAVSSHAHAAGEHAHDHEHDHDHSGHGEIIDGPWWRTRKAVLTFVAGGALVLAYLAGLLVPQIGHWAFLVAMAVGLIPVARRAIVAAMTGTPFSIETLMTIAAIGAVFIGATEEAAMVVLLFLVGELLEGVAAGRARASIRG